MPASNFALGGRRSYARSDGTPGWEALEEIIGGLEGGASVCFASGIAAIAAIFDPLPTGSMVALPDDCYQGVAALVEAGRKQGRWSVERVAVNNTARWVEMCSIADIVWLESPSNPLLAVADLDIICAAPRKLGCLLGVDNTFATPLNQRPLDLGADVSVQSATKFIGGHSDLLCGVATVRNNDLLLKLRHARTLTGATPGTLEAYLTARGARTLALRLERAQSSAMQLAERLAQHPNVTCVRYPGLTSHPTYAAARRQLKGFGTIISFDVKGSAASADAVCNSLQLIHHATSLGAVESTMERRASIPGQEVRRSTNTEWSLQRMKTNPSPDNSAMDALTEVALNLRWSWNHAADDLWRKLDPELWDLTRNPWVILQTVSREKLNLLMTDPQFKKMLDEIQKRKERRENIPSWYEQTYAKPPFTQVAYFSLEYMLSDALPIYSGGLGNVAGDQLKAASDLGIPVVGVGLLYQVGYFRQNIDAEGRQHALYPFNNPGQLPIRPVREKNGEWLRIVLDLPGFPLWIRAWEVSVGRVKLYLLDTNDPANLCSYRGIASELYGGDSNLRISQEQVLGIGGWRLLRALGIKPEVCHLNEGHAAFVVLERARDYMKEASVSFEEALTVTRAGNLFTTHTPVDAGFDRFAPDLFKQKFWNYAQDQLKIPLPALMALGRKNPDDPSEPFNMALLAMRGSGAVNGVSRLHGIVSQHLFQQIFPRWPESDVPIGYITNGVHVPIWDSAEADDLWTEACGSQRWDSDFNRIQEGIRQVSDKHLWLMRCALRKSLVEFIRKHLSRQIAVQGASEQEVRAIEKIFEPDTLTIGFARRFATYKRPNLLLHDPDRLLSILTNQARPVQLFIAGKAHPQDLQGQEMIQQWIKFIRHTPAARGHVVFLSDYDMRMAEHLVQGADVWLNMPRRPWEACGTSGMKGLVNGCLNLSELDGWWAEAYTPDVGWALGDGCEHGDDPAWDAAEAEQLYTLLEQHVIPEFYDRDEAGIPVAWIQRIRQSMAHLTAQFSATRCVREYTEKHYVPLASSFRQRSSNETGTTKSLMNWSRQLTEHWSRLHFGTLHVATEGEEYRFQVQVYLDELNPDAIQVELYAEEADGAGPVRQVMTRDEPLVGVNACYYVATVHADRPASCFTPRVIPYHPDAQVPLEASQILWYK